MLSRSCLAAALLAAAPRGAEALSACDDEAGQVCPMSIGKEIGECLQDPSKHQLTDIDGNPRELEPGEKPLELSEGCKEFIQINTACNDEIAEHCQEMYFHGDTMTCLTQWTKPDVLGEGCRAALPKKEEEDDKVDAEKEAWRAQKKAARKAAMDAIEKEKGGDKKKKKKKKAKKEL
eukprot:TRINITY_DN55241_c0_g1_i1.p1 TRINITY_DN55241_c0_g1~~TRINITY_DN55241_c0_g1_i1.p1  ORF type:complete len:199 (+),score=75.23 TRINITY_DN55241_c0_g1_i1:69-599(+)